MPAADPDVALHALVAAMAVIAGLDATDRAEAALHPPGSRARVRFEVALDRRQGLRDELRAAIGAMPARTPEGARAQADALGRTSTRPSAPQSCAPT